MEDSGLINRYVCELCKYSIYTYNKVSGTTPMFLHCKSESVPTCSGSMVSRFYVLEMCPRQVYWEWYKPDEDALNAMSRGNKEHVKMGGLLLRKLDEPVKVDQSVCKVRSEVSASKSS